MARVFAINKNNDASARTLPGQTWVERSDKGNKIGAGAYSSPPSETNGMSRANFTGLQYQTDPKQAKRGFFSAGLSGVSK